MLFGLNKFSPKAPLLLLLCLATACQQNSDQVLPAFNSYKFDARVIEQLPVYDSLVSAITEKLSLFKQNIDKNDAYQVYRYTPESYEPGTFQKILKEPGPKIDYYFAKLGKGFIYRFDVFTDSTVKIYIRNWRDETTGLDMEENLSYYPKAGPMQPRTFPSKDTVLTKHWQYWMRVNQGRLF